MNDHTEREPVFDIVKAAMMLWVIWGHLGLYNVVDHKTSVYMLNAKIGVNMPVFFVIGGCLASSSFKTADWGKLVSRAVHFLWPQIVMAIVYSAIVTPFGGNAFGRVATAWFLRTYATIYILAAIVFRMAGSDIRRWFYIYALYVAMLFLPSRFPFGWFGQVIHMFPYFCFGLMCLRQRPLRIDWKTGCLCGVVYLASVFLQGDSGTNGMNFWKANAQWDKVFFNARECCTFFARTFVGITGSVFVLFLAGLLVGAVPLVARLSFLGTTSLGVYVMHEYPLFVLGREIPGLPLPAFSRGLLAVCVFLSCHYLVVLLKRRRIFRLFFFGDEKAMYDVIWRIYGMCRLTK